MTDQSDGPECDHAPRTGGACLPCAVTYWQGLADRRGAEVRRLAGWLTKAVDELEDMIPYVPDYFRDKWQYDKSIAAIKTALHATDRP